jgi:hypothetical protein
MKKTRKSRYVDFRDCHMDRYMDKSVDEENPEIEICRFPGFVHRYIYMLIMRLNIARKSRYVDFRVRGTMKYICLILENHRSARAAVS